MEILALIPARAGSKRIPDKNIALLRGKPLIAYTIETALASPRIQRIIVSTDSEAIARIAKDHGAEVPFLRPKRISQSHSTEMQFLKHALNWLSEHDNYEPDLIVLLYPTSPFRRARSIDEAIGKIMSHPEADSLRSIKKCSEHPYKMWEIEGDYLKPFVKGDDFNVHTLSYQSLPAVYVQNASIYITRPSTIMEKKSPTGDIIVPFIMSEMESVDINTLLDFRLAESLLEDRGD